MLGTPDSRQRLIDSGSKQETDITDTAGGACNVNVDNTCTYLMLHYNRRSLTLGLGISAASLAMQSKGSKITWVVPSRYGAFSTYLTLPLRLSDSRCSDKAGRTAYGARRLLSKAHFASLHKPQSAPTNIFPASASSRSCQFNQLTATCATTPPFSCE